jgi:transcriptional regulator with XRE-family HTH domain
MQDDHPFRYLAQGLEVLCARDGRQRGEIAQAAGITPSMLSAYISGRVEPSVETLGELLSALRTSLAQFQSAMAYAGGRMNDSAAEDLEAVRAELHATVDARLTELGYGPGQAGKKSAPGSKEKQAGSGVKSAKRRRS